VRLLEQHAVAKKKKTAVQTRTQTALTKLLGLSLDWADELRLNFHLKVEASTLHKFINLKKSFVLLLVVLRVYFSAEPEVGETSITLYCFIEYQKHKCGLYTDTLK
jgi:hypothetical protein